MPEFAAILPAAGSSSRFGGDKSKVFQVLAGKQVLQRSIEAFAKRNDVRAIIIAHPGHPGWWDDASQELTALLNGDARVIRCAGGSCRAQSVANAMALVPADIEWVAIHDAARPLVSQETIDRVLALAVQHGAAAPALSVNLTIKQALGPLPAKAIKTVDREEIWAMQTPQIMQRSDWLRAAEKCPIPLAQVTDDAQILELAQQSVWLAAGQETNIKITSRLDARIAQVILSEG